MLNGEINGFKQQGQNLKEQFSAPFRKIKKPLQTKKQQLKLQPENISNRDIIRCAFGLTINNKQMGGNVTS